MRLDFFLSRATPLTAKRCSTDASLALFLFAASVTLVRLIVFRYMRQRQWWWDDFFALLGLLCLATFVPGKQQPWIVIAVGHGDSTVATVPFFRCIPDG